MIGSKCESGDLHHSGEPGDDCAYAICSDELGGMIWLAWLWSVVKATRSLCRTQLGPGGLLSRVRCQWHLPQLEDGDDRFVELGVVVIVTSLVGRIRFGMPECPSRVVVPEEDVPSWYDVQ